MKDIVLSVPDMSCGHCVASITEVLKKLDGVKNFNVLLDSKSVDISFDDMKVSEDKILEELDDIGFTSTVK